MTDGEPDLPTERLTPRVRTLWRLRLALLGAAAVVAGAVAAGPLDGRLQTLVLALPLVLAPLAVVVVPELRYRRWRFAVSEEEIDLRHGGLTVTRTLVPMRRVQHVDSSSGVLEQALRLATVTVHTAGGAVSIPGLAVERSHRLHQRIAGLARLTEDD